MRLNKFLAVSGISSRRQADQLIASGRVSVNGVIVNQMGFQVEPEHDQVTVDGKPVSIKTNYEYLILNKPPGYLTTVTDPFGRSTVMGLLPPNIASRLYPVGRLDKDTSGLLFFTNDGDLALALTHPKHLVEKTYEVTVNGSPSAESLTRLTHGIELEDGPTAPAKIHVKTEQRGTTTLIVIIREGRKRQVKRMMQAIGHPVIKLHRIAMGPLSLGDLKLGATRRPTEKELQELLKLKESIAK